MTFILTDTVDVESEMRLIVFVSERFEEIIRKAYDYKEYTDKTLEIWERGKNIASVNVNIKCTTNISEKSIHHFTFEEYREIIWSKILKARSEFYNVPFEQV